MSNDSISLTTSTVDFDSIEVDTILLINPDGDEKDQMQVVVRKVNSILTGDLDVVTAYLVEYVDTDYPFEFLIGEGEIVKIVEEGDEEEAEPVNSTEITKEISMEWS